MNIRFKEQQEVVCLCRQLSGFRNKLFGARKTALG